MAPSKLHSTRIGHCRSSGSVSDAWQKLW